MRPHLTLHCEKLLQKKNASKGTQSRKRVRPSYYGEALTSDELYERLKRDAAEEESHKEHLKKGQKLVEESPSSESQIESHDEGMTCIIICNMRMLKFTIPTCCVCHYFIIFGL